MAIYFTSLNSGSNGNCYYIGNETEAVLIDAGISCRETEKRMRNLGLFMEKVKAIFISHEHTDHIKGAESLSNKYAIPVYITPKTKLQCRNTMHLKNTIPFQPYKSIDIGSLSVLAFPKFHDAADPHSFMISYHAINIGVFTDIGMNCEHVKNHFSQCHVAFLESNYDEVMLENGTYPFHLKKRISGGSGHLSNRQAFELFVNHRPPHMSHVLLSHLSKENNHPELVSKLFASNANNVNIIVASRYEETALFSLSNAKTSIQEKKTAPKSLVQLNLFS